MTTRKKIVALARGRSLGEWILTGEALAALVLARPLISILGVTRSLGWVQGRRPNVVDRDEEKAQKVALVLEIASRRLPIAVTCLHRTLALVAVLRLNGIDATPEFGVRSTAGVLDGHAWAVVGGKVLGRMDRPADDYVPMVAFGPGSTLPKTGWRV